MARKNLLKDLIEDAAKAEADDKKSPAAPLPRYQKGAIGAVSQSINELKTRAIIDIDPHLIDAGGLDDRIEFSESDHKALMQSIQTYGQQVPILVRPHPNTPERYQIVYGRRRVLALRDLGQPIKAMVRDLDDRDVIMAQGQENSARKDLSFIEKANFARQMRDANYDRKAICDALHLDKTVISRMFAVVDAIPVAVIEAIGPAPSAGRDRWLKMAELYQKADWTEEAAIAIALNGSNSDQRFGALLTAFERRKNPAKTAAKKHTLLGAEGEALGSAVAGSDGLTLKINTKKSAGFDRWLIENFERIHREWKGTRDE